MRETDQGCKNKSGSQCSVELGGGARGIRLKRANSRSELGGKAGPPRTNTRDTIRSHLFLSPEELTCTVYATIIELGTYTEPLYRGISHSTEY